MGLIFVDYFEFLDLMVQLVGGRGIGKKKIRRRKKKVAKDEKKKKEKGHRK